MSTVPPARLIEATPDGVAVVEIPRAPGPWLQVMTGQRWWMLVVLTLAYILSFMDRSLLKLLVEPIKADLHVSDLQLSVLVGLSFSMLYSLCCIPMGYFSDFVSRRKLIAGLNPRTLQVHNDSHKHAHHAPMRGVNSRETHFRLVISSSAFSGKPQIQRHRAVNELLKEELQQEGGIHALQLRTMTLEEEEKLWEKAREIEEKERKEKGEAIGCDGACESKNT